MSNAIVGDLVSREAVKQAVRNTIASASTVVRVWNAIDKIPAVEAEPVIHCKDCQYYYYADNRVPSQRAWVCGVTGLPTTDDLYCADADRREE